MASSASYWGATAAAEAAGGILLWQQNKLCVVALLGAEGTDYRSRAGVTPPPVDCRTTCLASTPSVQCLRTVFTEQQRYPPQKQQDFPLFPRILTASNILAGTLTDVYLSRMRQQQSLKKPLQQHLNQQAEPQWCAQTRIDGSRHTRIHDSSNLNAACCVSERQVQRQLSSTFHCSESVWKTHFTRSLSLLPHHRRQVKKVLCAGIDEEENTPSTLSAVLPHDLLCVKRKTPIVNERLGPSTWSGKEDCSNETYFTRTTQYSLPPPPPQFFPVGGPGGKSVSHPSDTESTFEKPEILGGLKDLDPQLLTFLLTSCPSAASVACNDTAKTATDVLSSQHQATEESSATASVVKKRNEGNFEKKQFSFLPPDVVLPLYSGREKHRGVSSNSWCTKEAKADGKEAGIYSSSTNRNNNSTNTASEDRGTDSENRSNCRVFLMQYERCPFCRKVRACLDMLGIAYTVIEVNPLSKKELRPFSYRKVPLFIIVRDPSPFTAPIAPPRRESSNDVSVNSSGSTLQYDGNSTSNTTQYNGNCSSDTTQYNRNGCSSSNSVTAYVAPTTEEAETPNVHCAHKQEKSEVIAAGVTAISNDLEKTGGNSFADTAQLFGNDHRQDQDLPDAKVAEWLGHRMEAQQQQQQQQEAAQQHVLQQQQHSVVNVEQQQPLPRILVLHDSKAIVHALLEHHRLQQEGKERANNAESTREENKAAAAAAAIQQQRTRRQVEWLAWTDQVLVQLIVINVYRTLQEALETFSYLLTHPLFSVFQKEAARWTGSIVMRLVAARRQKQHHVVDPRQALADALEEFRCSFEEPPRAAKPTPFFGGQYPGEADLAVYGILQSARHCTVDTEVIQQSKLQAWIGRMQKAVGSSCALNGIGVCVCLVKAMVHEAQKLEKGLQFSISR